MTAHTTSRAAKGSQFCYVRHVYGVPAKRGGRVLFRGKPGKITSGAGKYIRIRLDGEKRAGLYHPTWALKYLEASNVG